MIEAQSTVSGDIVGNYYCAGTNGDGSPYDGVVTIARRAGTYYRWWNLQAGVTAVGVGLREGNTLGASYYGQNTGVVMYRIVGDQLIGRRTVPGADEIASERLTRVDEAPGRWPNGPDPPLETDPATSSIAAASCPSPSST